MVEIREMKNGEESTLMDLMQLKPSMKPLMMEETDLIYLFLENQKLNGFLALRLLGQDGAILLALETLQDHWNVQDGLMRTAFNALLRKDIGWVFAEDPLVEKLLVLKEHFLPVIQCKEPVIRQILASNPRLWTDHWQTVQANVIFQGDCKGVPEV